MSRQTDPRKADRRGSDNQDIGYGNAAPGKRKHLGRKAPQLPHTGCHLYQAPASPLYFPGTMAVYQRCPRHRPAASIDLGAVPGHCVKCDMEPFSVTAERMEY